MNERCAQCGCVLTPNTPEEEAQAKAEVAQFFPHEKLEDMEAICDDCWEKVRPDKHPQQYAAYMSSFN